MMAEAHLHINISLDGEAIAKAVMRLLKQPKLEPWQRDVIDRMMPDKNVIVAVHVDPAGLGVSFHETGFISKQAASAKRDAADELRRAMSEGGVSFAVMQQREHLNRGGIVIDGYELG